jgi:hypothetical protein
MNEDKSLQAVFTEISTSYHIPEEEGFSIITKPGQMNVSTFKPVEIAVFDLLGRNVIDEKLLPPGTHYIKHNLKPGIYIVHLTGKGIIANRKLYFHP